MTLEEILNQVLENKDFEYSNNGLNIKSKSDDNSISIEISYNKESSAAEKESEKFTEFLNELDDNLFIEVCDSMGDSEVHRIQDCLMSNSLDTVRSGIIKFKQELSKVVQNKIKKLEQYV